MDDRHGNRVENVRRILDQHIQHGLWCRIHYHYKSDAQHLGFQLTCKTDPALFDQPLTIEVATPPTWDQQKLVIKDAQGAVITARLGKVDGADALSFDVPPREGTFVISEQGGISSLPSSSSERGAAGISLWYR